MAFGTSPRNQESNCNEIILLYVLKDFQGMGIGKNFFDTAKKLLEKTGAKYFKICCNKYNKNAQNFYKKMGCHILSVDEDNLDKSLPQIRFIYYIN